MAEKVKELNANREPFTIYRLNSGGKYIERWQIVDGEYRVTARIVE